MKDRQASIIAALALMLLASRVTPISYSPFVVGLLVSCG